MFHRQAGQTSVDEVKKKDLRAELLEAEEEARNKKRRIDGSAPLAIEAAGDDEASKRRRILQEALELDKDEDDEDEDEGSKDGNKSEDAETGYAYHLICPIMCSQRMLYQRGRFGR